jgi:hypothetical protein
MKNLLRGNNMDKEKLKAEVKEISELGENWDGYGAEPITQKTIDRVYEVIECMDDKYSDPDVVPSVYGVQFEWDKGEDGLEIYIEGECMGYLKVIGKNMTDWRETEIHEISEINELLEWFYGEKH